MKTLQCTLFFLCAAFMSKAQYFIPEMDNSQITLAPVAYALTLSGDTIKGKVSGGSIVNGQLKNFTIKQENGEKMKFKSGEAMLLAVKPAKLTNIESAFSSSSVQELLKVDFDEVINREWVFFELALMDKKKDKPRMMQLLNPGFDSKMKVYLDPNANETGGVGLGGVQLTGGADKSYLIVHDGGKADTYKKKRYKKEARTKLYHNCEVFMKYYDGEKFKWRNFSEHVFVYDQLCE